MMLHGVVTIGMVVLGGYTAFFKPELLSKNIKRLSSKTIQWSWWVGTTVVIAVFYFFWLQPGEITVQSYYVLCWLLFIGVLDAYSGVIPNRLLYLGGLGWIILLIIHEHKMISLPPAILSGLLLSGIRLGSEKIWGRPGFGWGDIKLIFVLGLLISWDIFFVLYAAILSGGIFSAAGLITKKLERSSRLAFAPHIVIGYLLVKVFGLMSSILSITH